MLPLFLCLSLWVVDDVMSLALSPWVVSEAPRHFRSSKKQTSLSAGSFSVTPACGLSGAVHTQEFPQLDADTPQSGLPIPLVTFCSKLIEPVRTMACVVRLSLLEAVQWRAWVTAFTSIVKLEVGTV